MSNRLTSCLASVFLFLAIAPTASRAATYKRLFVFHGGKFGETPIGLSMTKDGSIYGVTRFGGLLPNSEAGDGGIFSLKSDREGEPVHRAYTFSGTPDGDTPNGPLTQARNGLLYGLTIRGGANGVGAIFSFDPKTKAVTVVHSFGSPNENDGGYPGGHLAMGRYGKLYGVTSQGGPTGCRRSGVFSFDPETSTLEVIRCLPNALYNPTGLTMNPTGTLLYGVTEGGGVFGEGAIFSISPANHKLSVVYSFTGGNDGELPEVQPTFDSQGDLFGVSVNIAETGGPVIYELPAGSNTVTILAAFLRKNGVDQEFEAPLVIGPDGTVYGGFSKGDGHDTVFSIIPATATLTTLATFPTEGTPSSLIVTQQNTIFGTVAKPSGQSPSSIFQITP